MVTNEPPKCETCRVKGATILIPGVGWYHPECIPISWEAKLLKLLEEINHKVERLLEAIE